MKGNNQCGGFTVFAVILLFLGAGVIAPNTYGAMLNDFYEKNMMLSECSAKFNGIGNESTSCFQRTIYVDDDNIEGPWDGTLEHPFRYIQDAVRASHSYDTVYVFSGIYYRKNHHEDVVVSISKPIYLIGEDKNSPFIDGENETILTIASSHVTIKGFTIQNADPTLCGSNQKGIVVGEYNRDLDIHHITISDCIMKNNEESIYIFNNVSNTVISDCHFYNNSGESITSGSVGDYWVKKVIITNCIIENNGLTIQPWLGKPGGYNSWRYRY
jgi:parallel beta-helix repeat protein